jgi:hypothetical protein
VTDIALALHFDFPYSHIPVFPCFFITGHLKAFLSHSLGFSTGAKNTQLISLLTALNTLTPFEMETRLRGDTDG